jgi:acetate---CoA ligase (ADP-forming)
VMKTTAAEHKTEADGIRLGLRGPDEVAAAYLDLDSRLGPTVTVSGQVPAGVEIGVGMVNDDQFGPVLLVSAGGALIELFTDRVALRPPVDRYRAKRAIERLVVSALLQGHRGAPPGDIDALADLVARFSELAIDASGHIASIDVNPVIVGPESATAVDVLIKWL